MDAAKISQIADIMRDHGLVRVRVEEPDGSAVELESGCVAPVTPAAPAPAAPAEDEPIDMAHTTAVRAPMVGVFYAAPAPGAEPFVHVGSKVKKGDTLCVIEAMKVMNEVTAEEDGEVVDVCVKDGDLVEYGCCLMKIY
ncbi:acetyl-CoA carboxylase biotin carboxyl carrier protein [Olsenella sp. An293]|uniref:acetyl-CoA carboxylase biotin carboxyl carrier protein n=1 Tax=Olsenella sp. An293 TaxID=1965626 RepID=UPI000B3999D2|nr:acetyl-CoA carboxylase biotin carboxyl carrier protein [Olsenella sp. An293]OUO33171.1 acetyl-CoA carboxylase, biotin carboxyl carrier protein [Olsenella sp. An293]